MEGSLRKRACFGAKTKTGLGTGMLKELAKVKPKGILRQI